MLTRLADKIAPLKKLFDYAGARAPDVVIVSHPKSGRTWLREILKAYFGDSLIKASLKGQNIPYIRFTHEYPNGDPIIIYLYRNPMDTLVSWYHHCHDRNKTYQGTISDFIENPYLGINNYICFHNDIFYKADYRICYEDMMLDTEYAIFQLLTFLGIPINKDRLTKAIVECSFDNMYRNQFISKEGALKVTDKNNPNSFKLRKGKVGGYKEELTKKDIEYIERVIRSHPKT